MEYHRITQKRNVRDILRPGFPSATQIWSGENPIFIPGTVEKAGEEPVFLPFYEGTSFLVSAPVKDIWQEYQRGGRYRPCALGSIEHKTVFPYSFVMPRMLDCLHPDTLYYKNGTIQKPVLDREVIGQNKVFGIGIMHSVMLFISDDVLEEMMRKDITGFNWETVYAR